VSADALTARLFRDIALIVVLARAMGLLFRRSGVALLPFALFIAASMSITAFSVLAGSSRQAHGPRRAGRARSGVRRRRRRARLDAARGGS
jgi:hypothetical protein